jgi:hypothetical protein
MRQRHLTTSSVAPTQAVRRADPAKAGQPAPASHGELLALQRTAGNAAVCQLLEDRAAVSTGADRPAAVQRGFFDDIGKAFSSAAKAVGSAVSEVAKGVGHFVSDAARGVGKFASTVGSALGSAAKWVYARLGDAGEWLLNLFRDLPQRLFRFAKTVAQGLMGAVSLIPEAIGSLISGGIAGFARWVWQKAKSGAAWLGTLLSRVFDLVGGPEIVEFVLHVLSNATPLTGTERAAAQSVLGANALRWDEVRIDSGGVLGLVFKLNQGRAFTTFHSINMTAADRADLSIVVHELTHVDQYEHAGSVYIGQALGDQIAEGAHAYDYGGPSGLSADRAAGKHYADYGRERQAQIAQDYYRDTTAGTPTTVYDPFIAELRKGEL